MHIISLSSKPANITFSTMPMINNMVLQCNKPKHRRAADSRTINPIRNWRHIIGRWTWYQSPVLRFLHNPGYHLVPLGRPALANGGSGGDGSDDEDDRDSRPNDRRQAPNQQDEQPPPDTDPGAAAPQGGHVTQEPDLDVEEADCAIHFGPPSPQPAPSPPNSPRRSPRLAAFWHRVEAELHESPLGKHKRDQDDNEDDEDEDGDERPKSKRTRKGRKCHGRKRVEKCGTGCGRKHGRSRRR